MVQYANPIRCGLHKVASLGTGSDISIEWYLAYPSIFTNGIIYHIYYSTIEDDIFTDGVKYVIIDGSLRANIPNLTPGQEYFFCVRPVEYDPNIISWLSQLPVAFDNVRFYPSSMLRQNMSATDLIVPLLDVEGFTVPGIVKVGIELIEYADIDTVNQNLIVPPNGDGIGGHLFLQSNDQYYLPNPSNKGNGSIANLMLINQDAQNQNWSILCAFVQRDLSGNPIPGTAKFQAIGSRPPGSEVDEHANYILWQADGYVVANDTLSFSIVETSPPFQEGDSFLIQVVGAEPGVSAGRGFNNTPITMHTTSGFDGYNTWSSTVAEFSITEDLRWDNIYECQSRFEYPNFAFTILDGYSQQTQDYLSTNLTAADADNVLFPMYDYAGYHRTDPVQLMNGTCVGSYIGGEMGCIDGYGNYNIYRGFSLEDQNTQRQDVLLSVRGVPACLLQRVQTGIQCSCYLASSEYQDDRCGFCLGTRFVLGYQQYFNPRISDGRIKVSPGPTTENLKMREAGLESEFPLDLWTLTVPTIKTRDVIVLFDQADNESFRYEVSDVIRNSTILNLDGGQHLKTFRIRKTDVAYQTPVFRNTAKYPRRVQTGLSMSLGIPPHSHTITQNEHAPGTWSQLTEVSQGHNHAVSIDASTGLPVVQETLGHTHSVIISPC